MEMKKKKNEKNNNQKQLQEHYRRVYKLVRCVKLKVNKSNR